MGSKYMIWILETGSCRSVRNMRSHHKYPRHIKSKNMAVADKSSHRTPGKEQSRRKVPVSHSSSYVSKSSPSNLVFYFLCPRDFAISKAHA